VVRPQVAQRALHKAEDDVTNSIAIFLGLAIVGLLVADNLVFDSAGGVFLFQKMIGLMDTMAIWR
jgi:hypothetical protein